MKGHRRGWKGTRERSQRELVENRAQGVSFLPIYNILRRLQRQSRITHEHVVEFDVTDEVFTLSAHTLHSIAAYLK